MPITISIETEQVTLAVDDTNKERVIKVSGENTIGREGDLEEEYIDKPFK